VEDPKRHLEDGGSGIMSRMRAAQVSSMLTAALIVITTSFTGVVANAKSCPSGQLWMPGKVTATGIDAEAQLEASEATGYCKSVGGTPTNSGPGRRGVRDVDAPLPEFVTDRVRASACVLGAPDQDGNVPDKVDMCSLGSDTCNGSETPPDERRWYFRVWERERYGPPAYMELKPWRLTGNECYRPGEVPESTVSDVPVRVVTWVDVYNAIRNEPAARKRVTVQPAVRTLVNLDTIVYTDSSDWAKNDIPLLGFSVDVRATPTAYRWDFGDGSRLTTKSAGRPYPAKDVTHRYLHRSDRVAISVSTTYRASFSVNGGAWQPIDQPLTVTGPATAVAVREAVPVLVAPDR
jgi:hypothetical protein